MLKLTRITDFRFPSDAAITGALAKSASHVGVGTTGTVLVYDITTLELVAAVINNERMWYGNTIAMLNSFVASSSVDGNSLGVVTINDYEMGAEVKVLTDPEMSVESRFGEVLSANGQYLTVSALGSGLVYVYREIDRDVVLIATLKSDTGNKQFGASVTILKDKLLISEPVIGNSNVVNVYSISGNSVLYEMKAVESDVNTIYGNILCGLTNEMIVTSSSINGVYDQFDVIERTYSVYFDGRQDYIKFEEPIVLDKDFTIEAWVFYRDTFSNPCVLGDMEDGIYTNVLQILNGKLFYRHSDINGLISQDYLKQNEWVHLKVVRVNNTVTLFVNGFPQAYSYALVITPVKIHYIGCMVPDRYMFKGFVSNLHIKGGSDEDSDFMYTVSRPYLMQPSENTLLLTCNTREIVDISGKNALARTERVTSSEVSPIEGLWRRQALVKTDNPYKCMSAANNYIATVTEDDVLEIYSRESSAWMRVCSENLDTSSIKNILCTDTHVFCAGSDSIFVYEINKE